MNYEEKYNEILEWARKNKARLNGVPIEEVLPELAESEDERIRKALIEVFKKKLERGFEWVEYGIPNRSVLDWLEKQKECLADNSKTLASEDERIRKELIETINCMKEAHQVFLSEQQIERYLAYLEKQKEQKQEKFPPYVTGFKGHPDPAGTSDLEEAAKEYASKTLCDPDDGPSTGLAKESFIAGAKWQKEQKSVDNPKWNELTWKDINELERIINNVHYEFQNGIGEDSFGELVLERFREYKDDGSMDEQKPAEWSEEDEKDMAHIIRILDDCYVYGTHDLSKTDHENLVNKLKSLRPSWKPNEEQMKALYDACCIAFEEGRDFHPSLSRLYHDLRKL